MIVERGVRQVDEVNLSASSAKHQKLNIASKHILRIIHCTLVEKVARRNRQDTTERFDDVSVKHGHRAASLVRLGAGKQKQVETQVWRRHQLLERLTANEAALKTA